MFFEILLALAIGICFGIFTGLVPGIHVNLVSIVLISFSGYFLGFVSPLALSVFIVAMAVTHTFLDALPSIYLGAPDADQVLNVLPGHRLMLQGMGFEAVKLTVIGSLLSLMLTVALIPFMLPLVPVVYPWIQPHIGWILVVIVCFMIIREPTVQRKLWALVIFGLSGILGLIVLNMANLQQPLFPMLSGLFGISTLLQSMLNKSEMPIQRVTEHIHVSGKVTAKAVGASTFVGSMAGMLPGLGAAQAAIIATQMTGNIGMHAFMILVGGINTVNFIFSIAAFYTLEKARNGAIIAVMEIIKGISLQEVFVFLSATLVVGGIAALLTLGTARIFSRAMNKVNYTAVCAGVILFVSALVFAFSGWMGIAVLAVSTALGIVPGIIGVGRNHAMGCLLLPVIIYFLV